MLHKVAQLFWNLEHTKADFPYKFPFFLRRICTYIKAKKEEDGLIELEHQGSSISMKEGDVHSIVACSSGLRQVFCVLVVYVDFCNGIKKSLLL